MGSSETTQLNCEYLHPVGHVWACFAYGRPKDLTYIQNKVIKKHDKCKSLHKESYKHMKPSEIDILKRCVKRFKSILKDRENIDSHSDDWPAGDDVCELCALRRSEYAGCYYAYGERDEQMQNITLAIGIERHLENINLSIEINEYYSGVE